MFDHQAGGLSGRQVRQRQGSLQKLAHVGHRQSGQHFDFELMRQLGVPRMSLSPVQSGFRHKPQRQGIQGRVVHPGAILARHQLIPPRFRLGILKDALGEVTLTPPQSQLFQRCIRRE